MSSRLVSFQCVYGRAELLAVRTVVASSADVLGLDMFVQSGFVFGCPATGQTVPPLLCPHHAARYYVFYFHVSCNTRHNKQTKVKMYFASAICSSSEGRPNCFTIIEYKYKLNVVSVYFISYNQSWIRKHHVWTWGVLLNSVYLWKLHHNIDTKLARLYVFALCVWTHRTSSPSHIRTPHTATTSYHLCLAFETFSRVSDYPGLKCIKNEIKSTIDNPERIKVFILKFSIINN